MRVQEEAPVTPVNVEPADSGVAEAEVVQAAKTAGNNPVADVTEADPTDAVVEDYIEE